jgi:hypothetical protein
MTNKPISEDQVNALVSAAREDIDAILERHLEPYWFGRPEAEVRAAAAARPEAWDAVPGYGRYQWSDKGRVRRRADGYIMKTRVLNSGYEAVNVISDIDGKQSTRLVAQMVLLAHHPAFRGLAEFPLGLETRHNPVTGPLFNAYPEGLWPGTKRQNAADKDRQDPQHPCRNAPVCGGKVATPGRRCLDCVAAVGQEAAELLRLGMPLQQVAERYGYTGPDWVYELAVKHGGYEGTKAQARTQHPCRLSHRLRLLTLTRRGDTL